MRSIIILALIPFLLVKASAQDCESSLFKAFILFDNGQVADCISKLEPCLPELKGKDVRFQAIKLLAQSHLDLGNNDKAKQYVEDLLRMNPRYMQFPNNDPIALKKTFDQFDVEERLLLDISFGLSINQVNLQKSYSAMNVPQAYFPTIGFGIGADLEYRKGPFSAGVGLTNNGFSVQHFFESEYGWTKTYNEQLRTYSLQAFLGYRYDLGKYSLQPYLEVGQSQLYRSDVVVTTESEALSSVEIVTKDNLAFRRSSLSNYGLGLKAHKKLSRGEIGLTIGMNWFPQNLTLEKRALCGYGIYFRCRLYSR